VFADTKVAVLFLFFEKGKIEMAAAARDICLKLAVVCVCLAGSVPPQQHKIN
jgi:hypothetical protein